MSQGFEEFHQLGTRGAMYPRADEINDAVFEWLQRQRADAAAREPIFLYVHYLDPHVPYLAAGVVDPASHDEAKAAYDTELRYLDDQLRRLVEGLEARLDAPTYTFMVSDHGEEFGEHGERGHGRVLYDEVLRIPALLHLDGTAAPGRIDDKLEGRDFFDLLNALATDEHADIQAWAGARARSERYAATYYSNRSSVYRLLRPYRADICLQAIEKDGYALIWSGQGNTYELYDLRTDPEQLHNLAARQPETVTRLAAAMKAAPSYWSPRISQVFNADEIERLRALGYLR